MRARELLPGLLLVIAGAVLALSSLGAQPGQRLPIACTRAAVPDDHQFVAVFAREGDTLANVLLADAASESLTAIRVTIAPGDKPLTVLLSGRAVWDFAGDVARVQRVLALSLDRPIALNGVSADRVEFPPGKECGVAGFIGPEDVARLNLSFPFLFGRRADRIAYGPTIHEVTLPAGTLIEPRDSGAARDHELHLFYPGGLREFDPARLVSSAAIIRPEVLPDMAGLMQLERSGAIRAPSRDEIAAWNEGASRPYRSKLSPNYRMRVTFDYAVTRETALPAGLNGSHGRHFLVLPGVQLRGKVSHSCVAYMDGFRVEDGMFCYGDEHDAIERLRKLAPDEALNGCRLIDAPPDASVEAVSIYEPEGAVHSFGSKRIAVPVDVRVRKPGNVILVLNTYEPAIWRVSFGLGTNIVGVFLGGSYRSEVEGVHPDIPIVVTEQQRPPPGSVCAQLHGYDTAAYRGGPNLMLIDRKMRAFTGRPLDGVRGAYKAKDVEIR